jgi:hypothetical protein
MSSLSYGDLSLTTTGLIYLNTQALRLCTYAGQHLLTVGTIDAAEFYSAEELIEGLHGNASEFDLPLPKPVAVPVFDEFSEEEQRFLRGYLLGSDVAYLKTLVPAGTPQLILDKAKSLGVVAASASAVRLLEGEVREKAAAALRNQILADKADDLSDDYVALTGAQEIQQAAAPFGVVYKLDPSVYERISRNTGGHSPAAERIKWPFNTMRIGDAVNFDPKISKRAQTAVHVYAARMGRTFKTTTNRLTKVLNVVRTEDRQL